MSSKRTFFTAIKAFLNREPKSMRHDRYTVEMCQIQSDHKVLEVGFGIGLGLRLAAEKVATGSGKIYGIELTQDCIIIATKNCRNEIDNRKVSVMLGDVHKMHFPDASFDRVFHTDCFQFFDRLDKAILEMHRVLKPGGLLVSGYPSERLVALQQLSVNLAGRKHKHVRNMDFGKYCELMEKIGFVDIEHHFNDKVEGNSTSCVAVAKKPV